MLSPEVAAELKTERFRLEIQLAAKLQHPHIVPLLFAGDAGGLLYFTMPFIEGESLRARIARDGALPLNGAVRTLRQLASALAYAHKQGVVHRDIKPDNILLAGEFGRSQWQSRTSGSASRTMRSRRSSRRLQNATSPS